MTFTSALRVALAALLAHKGRAILTSLGIVIGISAVIAMVAAGEGARRELDERLDSVGKNLILIRSGSHLEAGAMVDLRPLTRDDAEAIRKQVGPLLIGVTPVQITQRGISSRYGHTSTDVVGASPELQRTRNWEVAAGRYFNDEEMNQQASVCVLGKTTARNLFPDKPNPVGETIHIDRFTFRIVGVTGAKGHSPTGADQDDQVFMPLTTFQHKLAEEHIVLILAAAHPETVEKARDAIVRLMRERHRIKPGQSEDFEVSSVKEMAAVGESLAETLQSLVAIIASISLLVGGIGIMNIMLVSVTERTREIGIRMSLGATPGNILTQFLLEAVVLALMGGLLGITLGILGAAVVTYLFEWPLIVSPVNVLLTVLVAAGVGVFFGYYPAWKASRLDPIVALRME
jgi:putative ABC transport system permease protein